MVVSGVLLSYWSVFLPFLCCKSVEQVFLIFRTSVTAKIWRIFQQFIDVIQWGLKLASGAIKTKCPQKTKGR